MRRLSVLAVMLLMACASDPVSPLSAVGSVTSGPGSAAPELGSPYVGILVGQLPLSGTLGSGTALDPVHILTNAHVVCGRPGAAISLRRADGSILAAHIVAVSAAMDLAVLRSDTPHLVRLSRFRMARPLSGDQVWASGTNLAGPLFVRGTVFERESSQSGFGTGLSAHIGAVVGYSGGPLTDAGGSVLGLVTALRPATSSGSRGNGRVYRAEGDSFILGAREVQAEALRLLALTTVALCAARPALHAADGATRRPDARV